MPRSLTVNTAMLATPSYAPYNPAGAGSGVCSGTYTVGNATGSVYTPYLGAALVGSYSFSYTGSTNVSTIHTTILSTVATQEGLSVAAGDTITLNS